MDATPHLPRPPRVPVFNVPTAVAVAVGLLILMHAVRVLALSDESDVALLVDLALIPARWTAALDPSRAEAILRAAAAAATPREAAGHLAFARYILAEPEAMPWTFVSYGLLHGSWSHVLLNSVWLMAFGTPVARRCGAWRFAAVALLATLAGAALHVLLSPLSAAPLIGASGGVSGLMAAASRFVFQPAPRLPAHTPPWQLPPDRPIQSVPELLRNRSALLFLLIWLATNLLFGLAAVPLGFSTEAVAWDAHLGGFLVGFLALPLLDRLRRRG